jgi:hypothetical protein
MLEQTGPRACHLPYNQLAAPSVLGSPCPAAAAAAPAGDTQETHTRTGAAYVGASVLACAAMHHLCVV